MLHFKTKGLDICRIGKLFVSYGIKANITCDTISIEGNITDELLEGLINSTEICTVSNYESEKIECNCKTETHNEVVCNCEEKPAEAENVEVGRDFQDYISENAEICNEDDLEFSNVERGDVFMCNLEPVEGSEQGGQRPVVIVQCNDGNKWSRTTICLVCTSSPVKLEATQYGCMFDSSTMKFEPDLFFRRENTIMAEHIRTIDKSRLKEYVGTLKPEVMDELEKKMCVSLNIRHHIKTDVKEKIVYVDRPVIEKPKETNVKSENERKDVNMNQIQILSLVDISELMNISKERASYKEKVEKIVKLFGFDLTKNGVQYLVDVIIDSPKDKYFNLETLVENISKEREADAEEIKRLIVARVKETLHFKKAPTIDFVRLINAIVKQEDKL